MKATELIAKLARLVQEHGDLDTVICMDCGVAPAQANLKSVYRDEDVLSGAPIFEIYGE